MDLVSYAARAQIRQAETVQSPLRGAPECVNEMR